MAAGPEHPVNRRIVVRGMTAATLSVVMTNAAMADETALAREALARIAAGRTVHSGRVTLSIPELAENGNSVSVSIVVDSPMTTTDYVKTIHVVSEKNPIADVVKFHLSPQSGRARVASNIRLASTQTVTAIAEMSDGSLWSGKADIIVTLAACVDGG